MTVVFSAASKHGIVMAADCAVTRDFGDVREYDTGRKHWMVPGVGFVATWGARNGNLIGRHLSDHWVDAGNRTISDLARSVHGYLVNEYRPDEAGHGDVGYHIGGFYPDGAPGLFHSYFNVAGDATSRGNYDFQVIGPCGDITQFLYNGRSDIAHPLVSMLLDEIRKGRDARFGGSSVPEVAHIAHFLLRVATEITPTVSAPYIIAAKLSNGREIRRQYDRGILELSRFQADFA